MQILVLSFTRKAANELKERLEKLSIAGVKAMTFHSLCMKIIMQHYQEAGFSRIPTIWAVDAECRALYGESMRCSSALIF